MTGVEKYIVEGEVLPHVFTERIEHMLKTIGPSLVALGLGYEDLYPLVPLRQGEIPESELVRDKAYVLYLITCSIMTCYSKAVAAAYLRGSQPDLEDQSPAMMIREADFQSLPVVAKRISSSVHHFLAGDSPL